MEDEGTVRLELTVRTHPDEPRRYVLETERGERLEFESVLELAAYLERLKRGLKKQVGIR